MSLKLFKAARHMRSVSEFRDITFSAEENALFIHFLVTIQILDKNGNILQTEKKSNQQKYAHLFYI